MFTDHYTHFAFYDPLIRDIRNVCSMTLCLLALKQILTNSRKLADNIHKVTVYRLCEMITVDKTDLL